MGYKKDKTPYPNEQRERNLAIYELVESGMFSLRDIAKKYGIKRQRVFTIHKQIERLKNGS